MKKILLALACCAMTLLAQANPAHKVKINDGLTVSVEACSESIFRIKVSPPEGFHRVADGALRAHQDRLE